MQCSKTTNNQLAKALMFAGLLAVFGCNSDPLGPSGQYEVESKADIFTFTALTLEDGTQTFSYRWDNTGTQATVITTDGISSGSAILTVEDDAGTVVYQDDIANDVDADTAVGIAGTWRIEIDIQNVTGHFTVSIWKKT